MPDLTPEEVQWYTRSSPLDSAMDAAPVRDWIERADLKKRKDGEERTWLQRAGCSPTSRHHFTYEFPTANRSSSAVCAAGKSDCGGLSVPVARPHFAPGGVTWATGLIVGRMGRVRAEPGEFPEGSTSGPSSSPRASAGCPLDLSQARSATQAGSNSLSSATTPATSSLWATPRRRNSRLKDTFGLGPHACPSSVRSPHWGRGGGRPRRSRPEEKWTVTKEKSP